MMKIRIFGILFLISALICGGGVDSNQAWQTVLGLALALVSMGEIYVEIVYKENLPDSDKRNDASYPSFLKK